jgi:hypothetical protein
MRPEISDLVRGSVYKKLIDAPSTLDRPVVRGVAKNVFFITHEQFETDVSNIISFTYIYYKL